MKSKQKKVKLAFTVKEQIMNAAIASFRIEGIIISKESALSILKKMEANLEK